MCKLFIFKSLFAWKSLKQVVFELLSSQIMITYKFKLLLVCIWIATGEKRNLQVITNKNKIFET